jgi:hypothetical protein
MTDWSRRAGRQKKRSNFFALIFFASFLYQDKKEDRELAILKTPIK